MHMYGASISDIEAKQGGRFIVEKVPVYKQYNYSSVCN